MGPVGSLVHKRGALPPTCVWDTMSRPEDNIQVTDLSNWRHAISHSSKSVNTVLLWEDRASFGLSNIKVPSTKLIASYY